MPSMLEELWQHHWPEHDHEDFFALSHLKPFATIKSFMIMLLNWLDNSRREPRSSRQSQ